MSRTCPHCGASFPENKVVCPECNEIHPDGYDLADTDESAIDQNNDGSDDTPTLGDAIGSSSSTSDSTSSESRGAWGWLLTGVKWTLRWSIYTVIALFVISAQFGHLGMTGDLTHVEPSAQPLEQYAGYHDRTVENTRLDETSRQMFASYRTGQWQERQKRILFDVLRARYTSESGLSEEQIQSESPQAHLRRAIEINAEYLKEQTQPESLLQSMVQSKLGPIASESGSTEAFVVEQQIQNQLMEAAGASVQDIQTVIQGGRTERLETISPLAYSNEAYRALAYYRYASRYASGETQTVATNRLDQLQSGVTIYRVERATTVFEAASFPNGMTALRLVTSEDVGVENPERYQNRIYFTRNLSLFIRVYYLHATPGRDQFLSGGDHYTSPLDKSGQRIKVQYTTIQNPPPAPERGTISALELSQHEHQKLTTIRSFAADTSVSRYRDRLNQLYWRVYWQKTESPSLYKQKLKQAFHRYVYLKGLLQTPQSYHPEAYNPETSVYLDNRRRIAGVSAFNKKFDSAADYRSHVQSHMQKLNASLTTMEQRASFQRLSLQRLKYAAAHNPLVTGGHFLLLLPVLLYPIRRLWLLQS